MSKDFGFFYNFRDTINHGTWSIFELLFLGENTRMKESSSKWTVEWWRETGRSVQYWMALSQI